MQAHRLPAARGVTWVTAGFALYRRGPPLLTTVTMLYLLVVMACSLVQPVGPFLLPLLLPALTVLVANACLFLDGAAADPRSVLLRGLAQQRKPLLRLGLLQLAGTVAILLVDLLIAGGDWASLANADETEQPLHLLRLLGLAAPMLMALWFAPLLIAWDGVPAVKSMFFSLAASLRNWRAFLAYGATVMLIGVVLPGLLMLAASLDGADLVGPLSALLRMLMILIFAPVLMASVYLSYRDVFATPVSDHA